ncbi:MAG: COX15/CtaA family protein [Pseudomonadales bacterium]
MNQDTDKFNAWKDNKRMMRHASEPPKLTTGLFTVLVRLSLLLTLITVVLSAYIRLAENGLDCEPWPACYGVLGDEQQGITVLTREGEQMAHRGARFAHRYIASLLGLCIIGLTIVSLQRRSVHSPGPALPLLLLCLTVFLSILGYSTPTRTSPLVTLGNLAGGMAMLAMLWWLLLRSSSSTRACVQQPAALKTGCRIALLAVCFVLLLGAWVSANFAATACPQLPGCERAWLSLAGLVEGFDPGRQLKVDPAGRIVEYTSNNTIAMVHRLGAAMLVIYLLWLGSIAIKSENQSLRRGGYALVTLTVLQPLLGAASVLGGLPLLLVTVHNGVGALLLLAVVNLLHLVSPIMAGRR